MNELAAIDSGLTDLADPGAQRMGMPGQIAQDNTLLARFYVKPVHDKAASAEQGRPVFRDVTYIEVRVPGHKDPLMGRPVKPQDKQQFALQWAAYQQNLADPTVGTPLEKWPLITRAQVEELRYFSIKSVEDLANAPDSAPAMSVMGAMHLKQQAKDWLESARDHAPLEQMRAENADLRNQVETQANAIEEMRRELAELKKTRGGRGRKGVDDLT